MKCKYQQNFAGNQNQAYHSVIVTEGTNLRPIKAMRRDERFRSLAFK